MALDRHQRDPEYKGSTWAVVSVDPSHLRLRAKRINITMPERALDAVDLRARAESETRSGLLTKAAVAYVRSTSGDPEGLRAKPRHRKRRAEARPT